MVVKFQNRNDNRKPIEHEHRLNHRIFVKEIRLIGEDGAALGVMPTREAFMQAQNLELDLVEISPNANPPVCKIMDYSKYLYEKKRKDKLNKKNSKAVKMKEITIRPGIDEHDYQTKMRHAMGFLEKGDKVKIMLKMRGRELQHSTDNLLMLKRFIDDLAEISKIEQNIKPEKSPMVILTPKDK